MSRDTLLQAIDNKCIEKKTITFLFNKWHRRDELATSKQTFWAENTIVCDYS